MRGCAGARVRGCETPTASGSFCVPRPAVFRQTVNRRTFYPLNASANASFARLNASPTLDIASFALLE
jgi:hypothetical protein